eukprot:TRINITY_DN4862_c0_g1_i2.p1 TRINITY_DN4862_c0_g1~~TRINITY_DN4862_c0_g1_i2.p1  ORF type:complete len:111 (-),score=6.76 TRINITY_DN4862_c0_g1_i2:25-330(-)
MDSGGSMVARLKLKRIDGRSPPGVDRLYPAAPGLRRISQRNIHIFTAVQIVCLLIFCFVSFFPNPYLTSAFPIIIVLLVPLRRLLLPRILPKEALRILDAY